MNRGDMAFIEPMHHNKPNIISEMNPVHHYWLDIYHHASDGLLGWLAVLKTGTIRHAWDQWKLA